MDNILRECRFKFTGKLHRVGKNFLNAPRNNIERWIIPISRSPTKCLYETFFS